MKDRKTLFHLPSFLETFLILIVLPMVAIAVILTFLYVREIMSDGKVSYSAPGYETPAVRATVKQALQPRPADAATYVFFGDMMLGRNVENIMNEKGDEYVFANVAGIIDRAAATLKTATRESLYVIGNLEGPILANHVHTPAMGFQFSFPTRVAAVLKSAGFTHLSIANNHSRDWGVEGELETALHIREAGMVPMVHASSTIVGKVQIITADDVSRTVNPVQLCALVDTDLFSVLYIHWGDEYVRTPNTRQREITTTLSDCGVDAIIGHHPHVTQTIAGTATDSPIVFYSLGNFIFDQYFSVDVQRGLVVGLRLTKDEATLATFPVVIERSVPRLMREDEFDASEPCERTVCEFTIKR